LNDRWPRAGAAPASFTVITSAVVLCEKVKPSRIVSSCELDAAKPVVATCPKAVPDVPRLVVKTALLLRERLNVAIFYSFY
jgi:hypothetical protein